MSSSVRKARPGSLSSGTPYLIYLMAQTMKNLPAKQETWVQSLCQEDPLEKEMATHNRVLAWEILWTDWWATVYGLQRVGHN